MCIFAVPFRREGGKLIELLEDKSTSKQEKSKRRFFREITPKPEK